MSDQKLYFPPRPSNFPYMVAVLVMAGFGVIAVIVITLARPKEDNVILIGSVFGFLLPTTMALLAFMKSQETHLAVNSRLEAFIDAAAKLGRAEGEVHGRETAERRSDELAVKQDSRISEALLQEPPERGKK